MYGAEFKSSSSLLLLLSSRWNLAIAAADVNGAPREPVDVDGWFLSVDVVSVFVVVSGDSVRGNHEGGSEVNISGDDDGSVSSSELDDTTIARGVARTKATGLFFSGFPSSVFFTFFASLSIKLAIASSTSWSSLPQSAEIEISFVVFKL